MKIRRGDTVLIISGKDRLRKGKVLKVLPKEQKVLVEGIAIKKKHVRPKREGEKGQIVRVPLPFPVSKVKLVCPKCQKATRVGYQIKSKVKNMSRTEPKVLVRNQKSKIRICKKCGQAI